MARRGEVEIFGLSMLDTVTCGLSGGIVLMLFLASQIPPGAEIDFENERATTAGQVQPGTKPEPRPAPPAAEGERLTAAGAVTVYLTYDTEAAESEPKLCSGQTHPQLRVAHLRPQAALFDPAAATALHAYSIWWAAEDPPPEGYCLRVEPDSGCRSAFYVAGAHMSALPGCPGPICFHFSSREKIYLYGGCPQ